MGSEIEHANEEESKKIRLPAKKKAWTKSGYGETLEWSMDRQSADKNSADSSPAQKDHLRVKRITEKKQ